MRIIDGEEYPDLLEAAVQFEAAEIKKAAPKNRKYVSQTTKVPIDKFFVELEDDSVIFKGGYMEAIIPKQISDRNLTYVSGSIVHLFGIFEMRLWNKYTEPESRGKPDYVLRYMLPTSVISIPSNMTHRTETFKGETASQQCMVLGYTEGNVFIKNTRNVQDAGILKKMMDLVFGAFLPKMCKYRERSQLFLECAWLQGVVFDIKSANIEVPLCAQARKISDVTVPFRMISSTKDDPKEDDNIAYIKITDIPHITSTFTALTFQNMDYAITVSAARNRKKQDQEHTNVEEIIKY